LSKKVIVVGGVAGGASCVARLRRLDEQAEITLVERGPHVSYANCGLPYHLGGVIPSRDSLFVQTPEGIAKRFNVSVKVRTEAVRIDREKHTVLLRDLESGQEREEAYDALVLSPGAEPIKPPVEGNDLPGVFVLRNVPDLDRIMGFLTDRKPRKAVVVGAGYVGVEVAENLVHRGLAVTLVERLEQVVPFLDVEMSAFLANELSLHGVGLRIGNGLRSISALPQGLKVSLGSGESLEADLVILAVGVKPETKLAREAGLELGPSGAIKVDAQLRTSDPSIYAVGDAVEVLERSSGKVCRLPLAGPANRQGRLVADVIAGRDVSYRGAYNTSIVKVFDQAAASVGLSERAAKANGIPYRVVWMPGSSHAGYYPGASPIVLKLLFAPDTGKVLGAQAVGRDGVDKRIDVVATALLGGLTVYDLEQMDFAYAPPFSSAKDPLNHAAAIAAGILRGDHPAIGWSELEEAQKNGAFLLDVREKDEVACGPFPDAKNIPLGELRSHLDELPKDRRIVVACQAGLRGYLAVRVLMQHGFDAVNLLGGYKLWHAARGPIAPETKSAEVVTKSDSVVAACPAPGAAPSREPDVRLDACGLACPGPILKVKEAMEAAREGQLVEVVASDPGFALDLPAWARATGHTVRSVGPDPRGVRAVIEKKSPAPVPVASAPTADANQATLVVFSNELDRAMASLIIATGAASMGKKVTLFFTFWGLSLLRDPKRSAGGKDLVSAMFGKMLPKGPEGLSLSKMNFGGMGAAMMRGVMEQKNVDSVATLLEKAKSMGVRLVACQMSMDVMGIKREELIDGVEVGGVASYLDAASQARVNLFV
jgi:NADPH-dependent 2,4-dienoyl-CoA reductase/sulfur reductase-like enzyme/peroxiredoxin family protein/rhodanese-related sulfurtransferase/TusA-related sulfurtransferase